MFSSIKTSKNNKAIVQELTRKLNLGAENVIARIAFAYSLSKDKQLDLRQIQDAQGKEYSAKILFGEHLPYYIAMICVYYGLYKDNKDIGRFVKMHVDDGLELIHKEFAKSNLSGMEFLIQKIESGLKRLTID